MRSVPLRLAAALALLTAAVYLAVPALVGTEWARERLRRGLERATGREAHVGEVEFDWSRGLEARRVRIERPPGHGAAGPLLVVERLRFDAGLADVLAGRLPTGRVHVRGATLELRRDAQGRLDVADLLRPRPRAAGALRLDLDGGRLVFVDARLGARFELRAVDGELRWDDGRLGLNVGFVLAGGAGRVVGTVDLGHPARPFTVEQLTVGGMAFAAAAPLGQWVPLVGRRPGALSGRLSLALRDVRGAGVGPDALRRSLSGRGTLTIEDGAIASAPVAGLYDALRGVAGRGLEPLFTTVDGARALRFRRLRGELTVAAGRVGSEELVLRGRRLQLVLRGSTAADGRLDWRIESPTVAALVGRRLAPARVALRPEDVRLTLTGTLAAPRVGLDFDGPARRLGAPAAESPP